MASFKASSREFVPGGAGAREFVPSSSTTTAKNDASPRSDLGSPRSFDAPPLQRVASDLSVSTKEWTPGQSSTTTQEDVSTDYNDPYTTRNAGQQEIDHGEDFSLSWGISETNLPAPPRRCLQTIGLPEPIRQHFQSLDLQSLRQMEPNDPRYKELPSRFHSAFSLDDVYSQTQRGTGGSYGYPSAVYKAIDRSDSQMYALRRVDNVRITPTTNSIAKQVMNRWCEIRHPSICALYNISAERGGVFFLHAYHPSAQTLRERFIDTHTHSGGGMLDEGLLWRILVHLISGLRLCHFRGIPIRNISVSHTLITSGTIARYSGIGVVDVLESDSRKSVADLLVEDIMKLGYVMLSLATRIFATPKNVEQALQVMTRHYSQDMQTCIAKLLQGKSNAKHISQMCHERLQDEFDQSLAASDSLHSHLRSEYENGRMMKLMMKLNCVCERPDFANSQQWSETGDRYVLKLFRDYVYHQIDADGLPVIDGGHVISALNKLDNGDSEKILLSSRDKQDLLVVSFADVRRCLEDAIEELASLSGMSARNQRGQHPNVSNGGQGGRGGRGGY